MTAVANDHGTKTYGDHELPRLPVGDCVTQSASRTWLHVRRVRVESADYHRSTPFEFELHIDGERIITATELERIAGWEHPWVDALFRYGKAYIDGMESNK